MLYSRDHADIFFQALRSASVEIMRFYGLPTDQGGKCYSAWKEGSPIGVIEHFTAGVTWKGVVRWLNDGAQGGEASCQFLILDRMIPDVKEIYKAYPPLAGLKVVVIMLSNSLVPCFHAGWTNKLCLGIENRNAGMVIEKGGKWYWWPRSYSVEFPVERLGKQPQNIDGLWWEPYTYGQIHDNILLCQMLYCMFPKMNPQWFLPHSSVKGGKWDTGRAFPLDNVRDAVFNQKRIKDLLWLQAYGSDPQYMDTYEEEEDQDFFIDMAMRQGVRSEEQDWDEELVVIESSPDLNLQTLVQGGRWRERLGAVRRAYMKLGYHVPATSSEVLDPLTSLATYQFQKSMGLKADRVPGRVTQTAILKRLKDFRLGMGLMI